MDRRKGNPLMIVWKQPKFELLVQYMQKNKPIEAPNAQFYYTKFIQENGLSNKCHWKYLQFNVGQMKRAYMKAKKLYPNRDEILLSCPIFDDLEKLFDDTCSSQQPSESTDNISKDSREPFSIINTLQSSSEKSTDKDSENETVKTEIKLEESEEKDEQMSNAHSRREGSKIHIPVDDSDRTLKSHEMAVVHRSVQSTNQDTEKQKDQRSSLRQNFKANISQALLRKRSAKIDTPEVPAKKNLSTTSSQIPSTEKPVNKSKSTLSTLTGLPQTNTNSEVRITATNSVSSKEIDLLSASDQSKIDQSTTTLIGGAASPTSTTLTDNFTYPKQAIYSKTTQTLRTFPKGRAVRKYTRSNLNFLKRTLRAKELELVKKNLIFEKYKYDNDLKFKQQRACFEERIKLLEISMTEKSALKELEMKERIAFKEIEMKEKLELEKFKIQMLVELGKFPEEYTCNRREN